ncbi:MAG: hypothetical protein N2689_01045, partial [Verrucomicrobiae bacterium]|nr:hypothetical protein [Verrucomicrobiae bacterium]
MSLALLLGAALLPASATAQEPQFRQLEITQPQSIGAPLSTRTQIPQMSEDEEIGHQFLLRRKAAIPQFAITGDAQYFYTSNALLLPKGK